MEQQINMLAEGLRFPEGPAFAPDGSLWLVELRRGTLTRFADGRLTRIETGGAPNGCAIDGHGRICFCDALHNAIRRFDPAAGQFITLAEAVGGVPLAKPNDLAFDALGNLVFTCPGESRQTPTGVICCLTPDGDVRIIAEGLFYPNGLAFTQEGHTLLVAETYQQRIWTGDWVSQRRQWTNPRIWTQRTGGAPGPDGMAMSAGGQLHVAVFGSSQVKVYDPGGMEIDSYGLPGRNPTNCAFDPAGRLGLVVTEADQGALWSLPDAGRGLPLFGGGDRL